VKDLGASAGMLARPTSPRPAFSRPCLNHHSLISIAFNDSTIMACSMLIQWRTDTPF
jgi:hypothetical protein